MSIRDRIQNIATKMNVDYDTIKIVVYSQYGSTNDLSVEDKLKLLEDEVKILNNNK